MRQNKSPISKLPCARYVPHHTHHACERNGNNDLFWSSASQRSDIDITFTFTFTLRCIDSLAAIRDYQLE